MSSEQFYLLLLLLLRRTVSEGHCTINANEFESDFYDFIFISIYKVEYRRWHKQISATANILFLCRHRQFCCHRRRHWPAPLRSVFSFKTHSLDFFLPFIVAHLSIITAQKMCAPIKFATVKFELFFIEISILSADEWLYKYKYKWVILKEPPEMWYIRKAWAIFIIFSSKFQITLDFITDKERVHLIKKFSRTWSRANELDSFGIRLKCIV